MAGKTKRVIRGGKNLKVKPIKGFTLKISGALAKKLNACVPPNFKGPLPKYMNTFIKGVATGKYKW